MFSSKKSKVKKMRGSNSHGWGHKKKHRGSGSRGGFGLSGTGARGDAQKSGLLAGSARILRKISAGRGIKLDTLKKQLSRKRYFGKKGFTALNKTQNRVMTLRYLEDNFETLVEKGLIEKKGTTFTLNLPRVKYDKIVGRTKFTKKLDVVCEQISQSAKANIEAAGGKVTVVGTKEDSKEAPAKTE